MVYSLEEIKNLYLKTGRELGILNKNKFLAIAFGIGSDRTVSLVRMVVLFSLVVSSSIGHSCSFEVSPL